MVQVPGAARRAAAFRRMRDARSSEVAEDYVELVGDLIAETGSARLTDLADCLGVAPATAAKALQRLQRDGLVETRPYRSITLTPAGEAIAAASRERHRIVHEFLIALGVSEETAEGDTEGIEHHVSPETLTLFEAMTKRLNTGG
ncbi:manganese-binding transcriptional regulator MntR [Brevundimonas sp. NIBR11]|uniref:manganese-binding transcriptional regulator MntR n=1 Tax=Brevundimonas sp. NIBR11 TaxID=3015999 RepID=UPI0022F0CB3F|nr:manganese-binding transcriptional regulator MntR [Brevundimonas sp. NIBR11]WGM30536.1 Transcriptional regulator MntR [Brevundimonas sp. NIBR11]